MNLNRIKFWHILIAIVTVAFGLAFAKHLIGGDTACLAHGLVDDKYDACVEYGTFDDLYDGGFFTLFIDFFVVFAIFAAIVWYIGRKMDIYYKKWNLYQKIAVAEVLVFVMFAALITALLGVIYDGSRCFLDNCSEMPFILFAFIWGVFGMIFATSFFPLIVFLVSAPFIIAYIVQHIHKKKKKSSSPTN